MSSYDRQISGRGTPFATWQASSWSQIPLVAQAELVPDGRRLVVVAPHPDDEVLGTGGLIRACVRAGRDVLVIAVTDGDASHPGSTRWPVTELAGHRRAESLAAMAELVSDGVDWARLGIGDGTVTAAEGLLTQHILDRAGAADVLVSPWELDGHPDHEATARATAAAARRLGVAHLQVPIWGWHWTEPDHPAVPWSRAVAFDLDPAAVDAKHRAMKSFVSQLEVDPSTGADPILPDWALARLVHDREVFLR